MKEPRPRLEVVIDEIVLRGVPPEGARSAVAALEARLATLGQDWVRDGGRLGPRDEAFRRVPTVSLPAATPAALGESAAGAVWGAVTGGVRR
jgi:hypothetical protein